MYNLQVSNTILDHLHKTDASFHLYTPPSHRTYRVIIRNLHNSTSHTEISFALAELGHLAKNVYNAKNKNDYPLPLFFVNIRPQKNNSDIHNITSLLNTKVMIEKSYKKNMKPTTMP